VIIRRRRLGHGNRQIVNQMKREKIDARESTLAGVANQGQGATEKERFVTTLEWGRLAKEKKKRGKVIEL